MESNKWLKCLKTVHIVIWRLLPKTFWQGVGLFTSIFELRTIEETELLTLDMLWMFQQTFNRSARRRSWTPNDDNTDGVVNVCSNTFGAVNWLEFCIYAQWHPALTNTDLLITNYYYITTLLMSPSVILKMERRVVYRLCDCNQHSDVYIHNK